MRFAVADAHAVDHDRPHLAVKDFVRAGQLLFEGGGNSYQLDSRTWLIDITDSPRLQSLSLHSPLTIRIESGPVGECQNLAGARIFDNHRARDGVSAVNCLLQFPFRDVLDVL